MQFDNPMITLDPDVIVAEGADAVDLDSGIDGSDINLQEQIRAEMESNLNVRSFLHGVYYTVLVFSLILFFLEVEFEILGNDRINGMMAIVLGLGIASTVVKSRMDDKVYDPNFIASPVWRFILFIFVIIGEILLFTMARDLITELPIEMVAGFVVLVGAVNVAVLWQFTQEEFDDYLDPSPDRGIVLVNYGLMVLISGVFFILPSIPLPQVEPISVVLSLVLFLIYGGLFWTYAFYDRETINGVSRFALSIMIGLALLPLFLLLLDRLTIPINATVIIIANFVLCTLGFLTYNARARLNDWLVME